jgi:hypothetical protein
VKEDDENNANELQSTQMQGMAAVGKRGAED